MSFRNNRELLSDASVAMALRRAARRGADQLRDRPRPHRAPAPHDRAPGRVRGGRRAVVDADGHVPGRAGLPAAARRVRRHRSPRAADPYDGGGAQGAAQVHADLRGQPQGARDRGVPGQLRPPADGPAADDPRAGGTRPDRGGAGVARGLHRRSLGAPAADRGRRGHPQPHRERGEHLPRRPHRAPPSSRSSATTRWWSAPGRSCAEPTAPRRSPTP